ncbi:MAG TPA: hypothetical protein VNN07_05300 [Candidatus Tectomicrobia bacterium]|nr:hypothetical protein [Candidatus Tectomicrobia bacterium]
MSEKQRPALPARRRPTGAQTPPARKVFIVAADNYGDYESLRNSLEKDPGIEVVLDRRAPRRRPFLLRKRETRRPDDRRQRDVSKELRRQGWAVVKSPQPPDDTRTDGRRPT